MFITVSVGGMLAMAATAAATGAVAGLYIRARTVRVVGRLKRVVDSVNQSSFGSRWTKSSSLGPRSTSSK
jgi:hypothetical protein